MEQYQSLPIILFAFEKVVFRVFGFHETAAKHVRTQDILKQIRIQVTAIVAHSCMQNRLPSIPINIIIRYFKASSRFFLLIIFKLLKGVQSFSALAAAFQRLAD